MKKVTKEQRDRLIRLTRKRTRRSYFRNIYRHNRRYSGSGVHSIVAPKIFSITANQSQRSKVIRFISRVRQAVKINEKCYIDFSQTEKMVTCATLLLYSEVKNIFNTYSIRKRQIGIHPSKNTKVMEVLKQIGFLDVLGYRKEIVPQSDDVVNWKAVSGNNIDGSKHDNILEHVLPMLERTMQTAFYRGLTEAMANAVEHAYIEYRPECYVDITIESWWAFSQVKDGRLHVVFCDLGIGIPKSLPLVRKDWYAKILSIVTKPKDSDFIKNAMTISRTRTGQKHRGKGLGQLADVIKYSNDSSLLIHSNRGAYWLANDGEKMLAYKDSIGGTLIEWSVPINLDGGSSHEQKDIENS